MARRAAQSVRRDGALLFILLLLLCRRPGSRAAEQGTLPQHRSAPHSHTHRRTRGSVSNFLPAAAATSQRRSVCPSCTLAPLLLSQTRRGDIPAVGERGEALKAQGSRGGSLPYR